MKETYLDKEIKMKLKVLASLAVLVFVWSIFVPFGPARAAGDTITFHSFNSTGCDDGGTVFSWTFTPAVAGTYSVRTVVTSGGLTYMNQLFGPVPAPGTYIWALFANSTGGPTNGTYPIPAHSGVNVSLTAGSASYSFTYVCGGPGPVTWFNPGDGRVDPRPGDRVVAYCAPTTLDVWGVTNDSQGHRLFTFNKADLVKAGASGILRKVEPLGSVFAMVDAYGNYTVKWFGGPAAATGDKDFAKWFTCPK